MTESNWGKKNIEVNLQVTIRGNQGRKLEEEPEAEDVEERVLLNSVPPMACSVSTLYNSGPPIQGWYHPQGLGLLTPIINHENAPI